MKTSIIVNMAGNLERKAKRYSRSVKNMSTSSRRNLAHLRRDASKTGSSMNRMGKWLGGAAVVSATVAAGKQVVSLGRRLTRLGIQANASEASMNALNKSVFDTANMPDIRVDPSQMLSAIEEIVEKTGDLDFARANIRNIGIALQATGAEGQSIGGIMAEFQKMDIKDPRKVLEAIDTLNVQGKEGAFTLQNLAALGPRVITAYTSAIKGGRDGAIVLKEMGAALQVIRMGTGSSEMAATVFERMLAELQNVDKLKMLQKSGIQVFDPKQPGAEIMRPINEILLEIMDKTKGRRTILGKIFGDEAIRAFNALNPERMKRFMKVQGDGTTTLRDSARAANDAAAAIQKLSNVWQKYADQYLATPINAVADASNYVAEGGYGSDAYDLIHNTDASAWKKIMGMYLKDVANDFMSPLRAIGFDGARISSETDARSTVDVNIRVDQDGRVRVASVESNGIAGDVNIDTGPMTVGSQ